MRPIAVLPPSRHRHASIRGFEAPKGIERHAGRHRCRNRGFAADTPKMTENARFSSQRRSTEGSTSSDAFLIWENASTWRRTARLEIVRRSTATNSFRFLPWTRNPESTADQSAITVSENPGRDYVLLLHAGQDLATAAAGANMPPVHRKRTGRTPEDARPAIACRRLQAAIRAVTRAPRHRLLPTPF